MNRKYLALGIIALIFAGGILARRSYAGYGQKKVTLTESGSTLLYPLFNEWAPNYTKAIITTQATGSGTGISEAIAGTVIIGASDAFMTSAQIQAHPDMLNIPIAISSQYIAYNLPGMNSTHLVLSGPVIVAIYNGSVKYWDDPAIKALNPGVDLPHQLVIPVYRTDGSGDTNMFTLFLSRSDSWWNRTVGYGTNVNWPKNPELHGGIGNSGVIQVLASTPYSIGYVAMTYTQEIRSAGLGYAALINRAGNPVLPSVQTVMNAASQYLNQIPPDGRIGIAFAPGAQSYPIATFEYVIVKRVQPSNAIANSLKQFLTWAVSPSGGSSSYYMNKLYLIPLPQSVVQRVVIPLIDQISGPS
ncbi:MAG: phosphate ABC transporter substrate-binding protein PstS [Thermoprotei archaeon]